MYNEAGVKVEGVGIKYCQDAYVEAATEDKDVGWYNKAEES